MPTKTDRIFSNLPATFAVAPGPSPLATVVETYGAELQAAENALAAIMRAHWVDQADQGAEHIDDLARIAALYGLQPRPDDGIEEFRLRLKRWVRLFLEGPTTVRGLLRASSILLGVPAHDEHDTLDYWWDRADPYLATVRSDGRDAASMLLGVEHAFATGVEERAATLEGRVAVPDPVDLTGGGLLYLELDAGGTSIIDIGAAAGDPAAVRPNEIVDAINAAAGGEAASWNGGRLTLRSLSTGAASSITLADGPADAAPVLLGLSPRLFSGRDATAAQHVSPVDLSAGADLSVDRYVRLQIDASLLVEVDCAGAAPASTTLDEIRDALNGAFGMAVATHDGTLLTLTSPTTGITSSIQFLDAAAQDASARLFGDYPTVVTGADAAAATWVGTVDLGSGIDLSDASNLVVAVDGGGPLTIDVAGADPAATQLPEMVTTINAAAGASIASHNGRNLVLHSATTGPASVLAVDTAPSGDASERLLGLAPRSAAGRDAVTARIVGTVDLSSGVNLAARDRLMLAVDFDPPVEIDLLAGVADAEQATAAEIANSINAATGANVASDAGGFLALQSPSTGVGGRLSLQPLDDRISRRFVSRAAITEDASQVILGSVAAAASGTSATAARLTGTSNLSRGVDLRAGRYLRLSVDGAPGIDVDCAGPRPRTTLVEEVVANLNAALGATVASSAGGFLELASPSAGAGSALVVEPPRTQDALEVLLDVPPGTRRGEPDGRVVLVGTVDLGSGVDLSSADRIKVAADGEAPVEVACAGPDPAATTLNQVVIAINVAVGKNIASHDGRHLILASLLTGASSQLELQVPGGADATEALLGILAPRSYQAADGAPARVTGTVDLGGPVDLSVRRFLRLTVDQGAAVDVDCAATAGDPAASSAGEIAQAINDALGTVVASIVADRLTLTSPSPGVNSKLVLDATQAGDARSALLGDAPLSAVGADAGPARLAGTVVLSEGVDLSAAPTLRLALNRARPTDITVAGAVPDKTLGPEIVTAINAALGDVAALTPEGMLQLTATGALDSHVEVFARRHFEVVEYLSDSLQTDAVAVVHGDAVYGTNDGADRGEAAFTITSPLGADAPGIISLTSGWGVRLDGPMEPGESLSIEADTRGAVRGYVQDATTGVRRNVDDRLAVAPLMPWLTVASGDTRHLAGDRDGIRRLVVHAGPSPYVTVLTAREDLPGIAATARYAADVPDFSIADDQRRLVAGRLAADAAGFVLKDDADQPLARIIPPPRAGITAFEGTVVAVRGRPAGDAVAAEELLPLVDLTLSHGATTEVFAGLALGPARLFDALSVEWGLNASANRSVLVGAVAVSQAEAVAVSRGTNEWRFVDALASRYNLADFDDGRFAGCPCVEQGLFDISRFAESPRATVTPVFAKENDPRVKASDVAVSWQVARPATAAVNLPRELPAEFGARFNEDRFALPDDSPEKFAGVVTEPPSDPDFLVTQINAADGGSVMLVASIVPTVPIGFEAADMPFAKPVALTGGRPDREARLYVAEPGFAGFVELRARAPGDYGNRISVVACDTSPGRFDVLVSFAGARFESARQTVRGPELTGSTDDLLKPGALGVLQVKAGGIQIHVTRDGVPDETV